MEWSLEFWGESQGCAAVYAFNAAHAIRNSIPHLKFISKLSVSTVGACQMDVAGTRNPPDLCFYFGTTNNPAGPLTV
jgi:hypothetical protein